MYTRLLGFVYKNAFYMIAQNGVIVKKSLYIS